MAVNKQNATLKHKRPDGEVEILHPATNAGQVEYGENSNVKDALDKVHYFTDKSTGKVYEAYLEDGLLVFENRE